VNPRKKRKEVEFFKNLFSGARERVVCIRSKRGWWWTSQIRGRVSASSSHLHDAKLESVTEKERRCFRLFFDQQLLECMLIHEAPKTIETIKRENHQQRDIRKTIVTFQDIQVVGREENLKSFLKIFLRKLGGDIYP